MEPKKTLMRYKKTLPWLLSIIACIVACICVYSIRTRLPLIDVTCDGEREHLKTKLDEAYTAIDKLNTILDKVTAMPAEASPRIDYHRLVTHLTEDLNQLSDEHYRLQLSYEALRAETHADKKQFVRPVHATVIDSSEDAVVLSTTEARKFEQGFTIMIFRDDMFIAQARIVKVFSESVGATIINSDASVRVGDDAWLETTQYK
jgi:hypothetical protein